MYFETFAGRLLTTFQSAAFRRAALAGGLAAFALTLAPSAAEAQFFGRAWASRFSWSPPVFDDGWRYEREIEPRGMPPRAVFRMLRQDGYRVLGPIVPRGRVYLADVADGETGQHERLVIDAFSGDVVSSYPLGGQRFAPPANVTRVPRAEAPVVRQAPQRAARLAPPAVAARPEPSDPLVIPGIGAGTPAIRQKPAIRAKKEPKPKAVIARRAPVDPAKPAAPKPAPVDAQPPAPLPAPAESAKPAESVPAPAVAATPPAAPLPAAAPIPKPAAEEVPVAPLDDATPPGKPKGPVNDIPVAPLE